MRSRASSFKWEYPLLSLRSSSSFLRLLPYLLVTSISPFIFPSINRFRRQFLRKMWPIQLAFRFLISCRIFLCSLTLSNTSLFLTWSVQLIFSILLQHQHQLHYEKYRPISRRKQSIFFISFLLNTRPLIFISLQRVRASYFCFEAPVHTKVSHNISPSPTIFFYLLGGLQPVFHQAVYPRVFTVLCTVLSS